MIFHKKQNESSSLLFLSTSIDKKKNIVVKQVFSLHWFKISSMIPRVFINDKFPPMSQVQKHKGIRGIHIFKSQIQNRYWKEDFGRKKLYNSNYSDGRPDCC